MMYNSSVFFGTPCDDAEGMTGDDAAEGLLMSDEKKVFIFALTTGAGFNLQQLKDGN